MYQSILTISADDDSVDNARSVYDNLETLLMLFDGQFYQVVSVLIDGTDITEEWNSQTLPSHISADFMMGSDGRLDMLEEEIYRITVKWEKEYGVYELWDYQVNAAFSSETGTVPYNPYISDPSVLPVLPDDDIPAEKIAENAVSLAASYGSRLTEEELGKCQVIVSQYRKPDSDVYLFSTAGTWLVKFRNDEESVAWLYVDAHTGIPYFFRIIPDAVSYTGEPGVEPYND